VAWSENTLLVEELLLHTLIMASPHCVLMEPRYLRWVHWRGKDGAHCDVRVDSCGTSPLHVGLDQVRAAIGNPAFFARKFRASEAEPGGLLDYVDRQLALASSTTQGRPVEQKWAGTGAVRLATALASSTESKDLNWANAIDGDEISRWASRLYSDHEWIQVELAGPPEELCAVSVVWEFARAARFRILVSAGLARSPDSPDQARGGANEQSMDGGAGRWDDWVELYRYPPADLAEIRFPWQKEGISPDWMPEFYRFTRPQWARVIRLELSKRATRWGYSLHEVRVHRCPVPPAPKTAGRGRDEL